MNKSNKTIKEYNFSPQKIEIELKDLSFIKELPKLLGHPHKVTFYQLLWLRSGKAIHRIDFKDVEINKGEVLVVAPGQVCEFDTQSEYNGWMVIFTKSFFSISEFDANFLHTSYILSPNNNNKTVAVCPNLMNNMIEVLEQEMKTDTNQIQGVISQSILRIILLEIERSTKKMHTLNTISTIVSNFFIAVENNFKENKKLDFYIDLLAIGEKVLLKEVKEVTGVTPKSYLDKRVILEAKRLLVYSNLTVKEIGFSLGFEEPANFNNFFKKHESVTPIQFRQNNII